MRATWSQSVSRTWRNDTLGIYFAHMKNDKYGEQSRDPRHIYANPLMPQVCPILAIELYFLCISVGIGDDDLKLFPGSNQYDRFRRVLVRLLQSERAGQELEARGMNVDDFGTHSMRKGASTFVASGSTACPPSTAVHLRAGWTLGGVQDTYLRYESAGDMYVGRTVCGLPLDRAEFAILPPMFTGNYEADLNCVLEMCVPALPNNIKTIMKFGIASIVYHRSFLVETLPSNHQIFQTPLFRDSDLFNRLASNVVCRLPNVGDTISSTGVPPHVSILRTLQGFLNQFTEITSTLQSIPPEVVNGVIRELEQRAIGAGTVTRDGLERLLNQCLERAGIPSLIEEMRAMRDGVDTAPAVNNPDHHSHERSYGHQAYMWDGSFHLVPQDFQFPSGDVQTAWQYWCCGDPSRNYVPYRLLKPNDMSTPNLRKRLSDYRFLMGKLEEKLVEQSRWIANANVSQANEMLQLVAPIVLDLNSDTINNRKRRPYQVKWGTMVNLVRKKIKTTG